MRSKKRGTILVFVALFLLVFPTFVSAGCFLYGGNPEAVCEDLNWEQAAEACQAYDYIIDRTPQYNCDINNINHYDLDHSCTFYPSQCSTVRVCNVDCSEGGVVARCQFLAEQRTAAAGESVEGLEAKDASAEYDQWCPERCCRAGDQYCGLTLPWNCLLRAKVENIQEIQQDLSITDVAQCAQWCELEVENGDIVGYVLDDENNPLVRAAIKLVNKGLVTQSESDGSYRFRDLAPGPYTLEVSLTNYQTQTLGVSLRSGQTLEQNFTLTLPGGATIYGIIKDTENRPLPAVTITWERTSASGTVVTDTQGNFRITNLNTGVTYRLTANKYGYYSNHIQIPTPLLPNDLKEINFVLEQIPQQGISGYAYVYHEDTGEFVKTAGVKVYVEGVRLPWVSDAEGKFFLELEPGKYKLQAAVPGAESEPVVVMVNSGQVTSQDLYLTPRVPLCGPTEYKSPQGVMATPTLGDKKIKLLWNKPCAQVVSYEIKRIKSDGKTIEATFTFSAFDTNYLDKEVEWRKSYYYEIRAAYGEDKFSGVVRVGPVYVGDPECKGRFKKGVWEEFCLTDPAKRKKSWTCNYENKLVPLGDCSALDSGSGNWFCAPALEGGVTCKNAGYCLSLIPGADPFGLYYDAASCYGRDNFCYFDYTPTVVDKCFSCADIGSCFDYRGEEGCTLNNCFGTECEWIPGAANFQEPIVNYENIRLPAMVSLETGTGYCVEKDYNNDDKCGLCGSEAPLFENYFCTAQVCSGLGRCFSTPALTQCKSCGVSASVENNCYSYTSKLECTGSAESDGLNIIAGEVFLSKDQCGWGRCRWVEGEGTDNCIKDGDGNKVDDCLGVTGSELGLCKKDNSAPTTKLLAGTKISLTTPLMTFQSKDDNYLGALYLCWLGTGVNEQQNCDSAEDFEVLPYPDRRREEITTPNILELIELSENGRMIDGETYRLNYYSQDKYHNQEDIKQAFIFIDNAPPQFNLRYLNRTLGEVTNLEVYIEEESEPMSCHVNLTQVYPPGQTLTKKIEITAAEKKITFERLTGVHYNLTATCTDANGNTNTKREWVMFDPEQRIEIIYPAVGGAVKSTSIIFEAITEVSARCQLRKVGDDTKITDFQSLDGKNHQTKTVSGYTPPGDYLNYFKIVCTELLTGEEMTDYFSFVVDWTAPRTQIILNEGLRYVRPTGYNWEGYFIEKVLVDFECQAEGFSCRKTFYCLDDSLCAASPNHPAYEEYVNLLTLDQTSRICYYSVDAGGNKEPIHCGDLKVEGYGITLLRPPELFYQGEKWGITNKPKFDWSFLTKVPTTTCKFDFISGFDYINVPAYRILLGENNLYLFADFPGAIIAPYPASGGIKTVYVRCENLVAEVGPEHKINLEYDPTAPEIKEAYADPAKIYEETRTVLYVVTDDKTFCRYADNSSGEGSDGYESMNPFSPDDEENKILRLNHEIPYYINLVGNDGKKDYFINVLCQNGAGNSSPLVVIPFLVDYSMVGFITFLSPSGYLKTNNVTLSVGTSKNALCEYWDNNTFKGMEGGGGVTHTKSVSTVEEKAYLFPVRCSISDQVVENKIMFIIDRTAPTITEVNDGNITCSLEEINVLVYSDEENVSAYYYELYQKSVTSSSNSSSLRNSSSSREERVTNGTVLSEAEFKIKDLNLSEGKTYSVKVSAGDAAGNWGQFKESNGVMAVSGNHSRCLADNQAPTVDFVINESCTKVNVEIHCEDEVGCRNLRYGKSVSASACNATTPYNGKVTFEDSGWLCYYVEDAAGNNYTGKKMITFHDDDGDGIGDDCDQCPGTAAGKVVNEKGCATGEVPDTQKKEDTDGDGLPDYWEKIFNKIGCDFDYQNEDTDGDGITDDLEDYDEDGFKNYEEYAASTDPCRKVDQPIGEPYRPTSEVEEGPEKKPPTLAWVLLVLGLLMFLGGGGYLIYYYFYSQPPSQREETLLEGITEKVPSGGPAGKPSREESLQQGLMRLRLAKSRREKEKQRKSIFGTFRKSSPTIPHLEEVLKKRAPPLAKVSELAQKYSQHKEEIEPGLKEEEKDVFARLDNIAQQTQVKGIGEVISQDEAKEVFSKLKEITEKRKKTKK